MSNGHKSHAPLLGSALTEAAKWAIHFPAARTFLPEYHEYPSDLPREAELTRELDDLIAQFRIGALVPGFPDDYITRGRLHPRILFQKLDEFEVLNRLWTDSILGVAFPIDDLRQLGTYSNVIPGMSHCHLHDFEAWDCGRAGGKKVLVPDGKGDFEFAPGLPLFIRGESAFSAMVIMTSWWHEAERIQRFLTARQVGYRLGVWDEPFQSSAERMLANSVVLCAEELDGANPCSIEGLKLGEYVYDHQELWEIPGVERRTVTKYEWMLIPVFESLLSIAEHHRLEVRPTGDIVRCVAFEAKPSDPLSDFLIDSGWAIPAMSDRPGHYLFNLTRWFGSPHGATPLGLRLVRKVLNEQLELEFFIREYDFGKDTVNAL